MAVEVEISTKGCKMAVKSCKISRNEYETTTNWCKMAVKNCEKTQNDQKGAQND